MECRVFGKKYNFDVRKHFRKFRNMRNHIIQKQSIFLFRCVSFLLNLLNMSVIIIDSIHLFCYGNTECLEVSSFLFP